MEQQLIDGAVVRMGGRDFTVPPLSLGQLRRLLPKISSLKNLDASMSVEQMDSVTEIIHTALGRNYPDLTTQEVDEMLDMNNMLVVLKAVMGQSGLTETGGAKAGNQ